MANNKVVVSIHEMDMETQTHGDRYHSKDGFIGDALGLTALGIVITEVDPGKTACPFHVHHVEDELFLILEGTGTYRFGEQEFAVKAGDCLGAPAGDASRAHQLTNTGDVVLKYFAISSRSKIDVCEYPDSGKFMVSSRRGSSQPFRYIGREASGLDYWDGEE